MTDTLFPPLVAVTATTTRDRDARSRVRLNASYVRALEAAGLVPIVVPPLAAPDAALPLLDVVAGLVLTGGEDVDPTRYGARAHPALGPVVAARDETELALAIGARSRGLPTLAICRGIQVLNVALGGTLVQDLPSERPAGLAHDPGGARDARVHAVDVTPGSRLAAAMGSASPAVNSFHHQAVDRVAEGLVVTARAPDGVVEGVETTDDAWWALGVQWHPEELTETAEPWDRGLFRAFAERVRADRAYAGRR